MNKLVRLIVYLLVGSLLLLTSTMSYDFIARTMPPGQQLLAVAALAALGVGAVGWTLFHKASVGWPKWLSLLLVVIDVVGEMTLFMADLFLNSASRFGMAELAPEQATYFLLAFGAVIALNVSGAIAIEILEPGAIQHSQEMEAENERAEAELEIRKVEFQAEMENRKALALAIKERARQYNSQRIPQLLESWQIGAETKYNSLETSLRAGYKPGSQALPERRNGHKPSDNIVYNLDEEPQLLEVTSKAKNEKK